MSSFVRLGEAERWENIPSEYDTSVELRAENMMYILALRCKDATSRV